MFTVDTLPPCKCANPAICNMDYPYWHVEERYTTPHVNRVCTRCWMHWAGPADAVKVYTRAEWDAYIAESLP